MSIVMSKVPHCSELTVRAAWSYLAASESGDETREQVAAKRLSWTALQELAAINALGYFNYPPDRFPGLRDTWVKLRRWPVGWEPQAIRDGLRKLGLEER